MRVVVLGANSISTPCLVRDLARHKDLRPLHLTLAGRSGEHLAAIGRASAILAAGSSLRVETAQVASGCPTDALDGADLVLVQVRVGGYAARQYDETFPLEFDLVGDEGLGPGGLAAAWRTWPVLEAILREVCRACPAARVLVLTSPVSLLVRMARTVFPELSVEGICELPFVTLLSIARGHGVHWTELSWDYLGINHIGSLYGIPGLAKPIGLKYLRLETARSEVLALQKAHPGRRAIELSALVRPTMDVYARGGWEQIDRALSARQADWYGAAVGPYIAALGGCKVNTAFFLSVSQQHWSRDFEPDDILEVPHAPAPRPNAVAPPPELLERILGFVRYERLAARAVVARDRGGIERAISLHPWVSPSVPVADLCARVCAGLPG
jgi:6-phospho-beta-glucosidase